MAATARVNPSVAGKEIVIFITKPSGSTPILFGCMSAADYDSDGAEIEELACRAGITKTTGDIAVPVLSLEHLVRAYPDSDKPTNVSDDEIQQWVETAAQLPLKYSVGVNIGDPVYTGTVVLTGFSRKGPQKGPATGSFKANFLAMPIRSTVTSS